MHATIRAFWLPKAGNSPEEYEDAFWPTEFEGLMPLPVRLAVGDGATETSFSASWARLLVEDYGMGHLTDEMLRERLPLLRDRWKESVSRESLPWYAEEKLRAGAFSSLVGLTIWPGSEAESVGGGWKAMAIGDSCLFQVRGDKLISAFPLDRTDQFDNRPILIPSGSVGDEGLRAAVRVMEGDWEAGDIFYLMSDALACWFLRRWELPDGDPLFFMEQLREAPDFDGLVREQRADEREDGQPMLRNDDVTLVRCRIEVSE